MVKVKKKNDLMTTNENRLLLYNASDKKHTIIWMIYMKEEGLFY